MSIVCCTCTPDRHLSARAWLQIATQHAEETKELQAEIARLTRALSQGNIMTYRDETHPLVEAKYLAEFEQGKLDPNHVAAVVEHFLRLGPVAGDDVVKRTLVHGGVNIRLWTANAIANRMTLQRKCIVLANEWLKSRGAPLIDVDRLEHVQETLQPFILPNDMYKSLGSHFVAKPLDRSYRPPLNALHREMCDNILEGSTIVPAHSKSSSTMVSYQAKRSFSTNAHPKGGFKLHPKGSLLLHKSCQMSGGSVVGRLLRRMI